MADIRTVLLAVDFREDLMAQLESAFATPRVADFEGSSAAPLLENIRRYRAGEPMVNQLLARDVLTP